LNPIPLAHFKKSSLPEISFVRIAVEVAKKRPVSDALRAGLSEAKPPQMKDRISLPPPRGMRGLSRMQQGGIGD